MPFLQTVPASWPDQNYLSSQTVRAAQLGSYNVVNMHWAWEGPNHFLSSWARSSKWYIVSSICLNVPSPQCIKRAHEDLTSCVQQQAERDQICFFSYYGARYVTSWARSIQTCPQFIKRAHGNIGNAYMLVNHGVSSAHVLVSKYLRPTQYDFKLSL